MMRFSISCRLDRSAGSGLSIIVVVVVAVVGVVCVAGAVGAVIVVVVFVLFCHRYLSPSSVLMSNTLCHKADLYSHIYNKMYCTNVFV